MPVTFPQSPLIQAILLENAAHPARGLLGKTLFASGFNLLRKEGTAAKGSGLGEVGTPRPQGDLGKARAILMTLMPGWLPPGTLLRLSPPASSGAWPRLSTLTSPSPICSSVFLLWSHFFLSPPGQGPWEIRPIKTRGLRVALSVGVGTGLS